MSKAFELKIDTLDTAEAYGNAHQVIGHFHKLNPRIKFKVITKIPHGVLVDEIEQKIKVNNIKADMRDQVDENVRNQYLAKFRKEVDFHHKVAYRYEKAYRLGKKQP